MNIFPVFGAFLESSATILEKKILKSRSLNYKNYPVYSFLAIIVIAAVFSIFLWKMGDGALELRNILIFAAVIVMAAIANLLTYYSLKRENLSEFEPFWLMQSFFIILLAVLFYDDERNWIIVGFAFVASIALIVSHIKKSRISFDRYNLAVLFADLFFAGELVLSKQILEFYSPMTFYFIRCFFLFFLLFIIFRPKFNTVKKNTWGYIFLIAFIWIFYRIIVYFAYGSLGIVYTTSLVIISPVLTLGFAVFFLKEKPTIRQVICNSIIILCVAGSAIFG